MGSSTDKSNEQIVDTMIEAAKLLNDQKIPTKGRMVYRDGILYELDNIQDKKALTKELLSV